MQIARQRLKGLLKESTALGCGCVTGVLLAVGLVLLPAGTSAEQRNVVPVPQPDFVPSRDEFTPSLLLLEFDEDSYCESEEYDRDSDRVTRDRSIWRHEGYVENLRLDDRPDAVDAESLMDWCRGELIGYGECESDTGSSIVFTTFSLSRSEEFYRLTFEGANRGSWSVSSVTAGASYSNDCSGSGSFRWIPGAPDSGPVVEEALGLDRSARRQIQLGLQSAGFDPGGADGLFGPRTRAAIRAWQSSRGVRATGYLDGPAVEALRTAGVSAPAVAVQAAPAPAQAPPVASAEQETVFWQSIADSTNPAEYEAYLSQFPNGVFSALARARLASLQSASGASTAATGARRRPAAAPSGRSTAQLEWGELTYDAVGSDGRGASVFLGEAAQVVRVSVQTDFFFGVLRLISPTDQEIASDSGSMASGPYLSLEATLPESGPYRVEVSGGDDELRGYSVMVELEPPSRSGIERFRHGNVDMDLWVLAELETPEEGFGYGKYVEVKKGETTIFRHAANEVGRVLLSAGLVESVEGRLYLVTRWSTGAHSVQLVVYDVSQNGTDPEDQVVFQFTGAYYVEMEVNSSRLIARGDGTPSRAFLF